MIGDISMDEVGYRVAKAHALHSAKIDFAKYSKIISGGLSNLDSKSISLAKYLIYNAFCGGYLSKGTYDNIIDELNFYL